MFLRYAGIFSSFFIALSTSPHEVTLKDTKADEQTVQLKVTFNLDPQEILYKDSLQFSIDSPDITLSQWHSNTPLTTRYNEITKKTDKIFDDQTVVITLFAKKNQTVIEDDVHLYITYQTNFQTHPLQKLFLLESLKNTLKKQGLRKRITTQIHQKNNSVTQKNPQPQTKKPSTLTKTISRIIKHSYSLPIRLAFVFLLGILLSLTPCIYPMIPITVGILHGQKTTSMRTNFFIALSYSFGLATTFAIFGLLASYTGPFYGKLLNNPLAVLLLVTFLCYLGLSMFGFYELKIPSLLPSTLKNRSFGGPLLSSFLFGAVSGTIASPCVSPGLILLLSIVATIGNVLYGFLLLFVFGLGLSAPLLIVGTFSSSLELLPRAGMWMNEIKKIFGLLLFAAAFYYLSNVIAENTLCWLIAAFMLLLGTYYLYSSDNQKSIIIKRFYTIFGFCLVASSVVLCVYAYQALFVVEQKSSLVWHTDYEKAREIALKENKKLFIDFWADYCTLCKRINSTTLQKSAVVRELEKMILVNVDGSDEHAPAYKKLQQQFSIVGFPTFLIVEPHNETVLKRWHSEIYQLPIEKFTQKLQKYATK